MSILVAITACCEEELRERCPFERWSTPAVAKEPALRSGLGSFATELHTERAADLVEFGVDLLFVVAHFLKERSVVLDDCP